MLWQWLWHMIILFWPSGFFLGRYMNGMVNVRTDPFKFWSWFGSWTLLGLVVASAIGITDILTMVLLWITIVVSGHSFLLALETHYSRAGALFASTIPVAMTRQVDADGNVTHTTHSLLQNIEQRVDGKWIASNNYLAVASHRNFALYLAVLINVARRHLDVEPVIEMNALQAQMHEASMYLDGVANSSQFTTKPDAYKDSHPAFASRLAGILRPLAPFEHGLWAMAGMITIFIAYYAMGLISESNTYKWWAHVGMWFYLLWTVAAFGWSWYFWWEPYKDLHGRGGFNVYDYTITHYVGSAVGLVLIGYFIIAGGHNRGLLY